MTRGRISLYLDLETYEEMRHILTIRSALVNQMMLAGISHSDLDQFAKLEKILASSWQIILRVLGNRSIRRKKKKEKLHSF